MPEYGLKFFPNDHDLVGVWQDMKEEIGNPFVYRSSEDYPRMAESRMNKIYDMWEGERKNES